jgi:hypothetical protein
MVTTAKQLMYVGMYDVKIRTIGDSRVCINLSMYCVEARRSENK